MAARIAHTGGHQQLQAGQPGQEAGRERDVFAKGDHDVEVLERGGEMITPQRARTVRGQAGRAAVAAWVMFFAMPPKTTAWKGETLHQ